MRQFLLVLLIFGIAWAGDEPEDEHPATLAVQDYIEAFFAIDYEAAQALLCAADLETLDQATFEQALDTVTELDYTSDLSELEYNTLELGETLAEINVTGEIIVEIDSRPQPVILEPRDVRLDSIWAIYENETWKMCSQVPSDLIGDLGPDVIARVFMDAAYKGDYEQAHMLVCEAQEDTLSEAEFDRIFGGFLQQDVRFNFHPTTFEITEQTDNRAVVTLTGDILMNVGERPSPVTISAETLGLRPVHLRYEDGWKVCDAS